jgi:hypothetical protein
LPIFKRLHITGDLLHGIAHSVEAVWRKTRGTKRPECVLKAKPILKKKCYDGHFEFAGIWVIVPARCTTERSGLVGSRKLREALEPLGVVQEASAIQRRARVYLFMGRNVKPD